MVRPRWIVLLLVAVGAAAWMVSSWVTNPPVEPTDGLPRYGGNYAGGLRQGLSLLGAEFLLVASVVRPWSYNRSWPRAVSLIVPAGGLVVLLFATVMHSSPIHGIHLLWALFLLCWLCWIVVADWRPLGPSADST